MELTTETYKAALKKVAAKPKEEQYMLLEFHYTRRVILPMKNALAIIAALEGANLIEDEDYGVPTFIPITKEFSFRLIPEKELNQIKVAVMLQVPMSEIKYLKDT